MKRTLGVLGGMGPQATIDFMQKVLDFTILAGASRDQEHLRIITDSHPQIPDRTQAIFGNGESPVPAMMESLSNLINCGAQCIAMPCVTAHYFLPKLNVPEGVQFLNMLEIAGLACRNNFGEKTVGVLATPGTAKSGALAAALKKAGVRSLFPGQKDQELLGQLILNVKAKGATEEIAGPFNQIAENMRLDGADYYLLACTEIPLMVQVCHFPYPFVDATAELARAAVAASYC